MPASIDSTDSQNWQTTPRPIGHAIGLCIVHIRTPRSCGLISKSVRFFGKPNRFESRFRMHYTGMVGDLVTYFSLYSFCVCVTLTLQQRNIAS